MGSELLSSVTASSAKQNFGELLAAAARAPVTIERHGKPVAVIGPPALLSELLHADPRRAAREEQRQVEMRRLLKHHRIASVLATAQPAQRRLLISTALLAVDRWERDHLCSPEYVQRWRQWLARPVGELAVLMTSTHDPWAPAMRQNSPFHDIAPVVL